MAKIEETQLPGVGVRHEFVTGEGDRMGVITHRTGRRDLLIYDPDDPDACRATIRLSEEDSRTLADLLGGSRVTETVSRLQQSVEGLTIDWLPIREVSACAGGSIQDFGVRGRTGVSVVAVVRNGETIPSPGPDFRMRAGDTAVAVGTPEGIRKAFSLLRGS